MLSGREVSKPGLREPGFSFWGHAVTEPLYTSPITSPCTGVCRLGSDGLCDGCLRTASEIGNWIDMADSERRRLMDDILPLRDMQRLK
jgi:predicted Fe-S protein YdhL (DUF1289 family)